MSAPDIITLSSSDDESKPAIQGAALLSKKKNMNASTRNMKMSTRNINTATQNINVRTRNMNMSTRNLSVPKSNIPINRNNLKNIPPANSFHKTNPVSQKIVVPYNKTKVTEPLLNKHQYFKTNSTVIPNSQIPKVAVMPKQTIFSQQQTLRTNHSSNSVPVQYLPNVKNRSNSQLKTVQPTLSKSNSNIKLNHASQSISMPVGIKIPKPTIISNPKTIQMKNTISHTEKSQTVKSSPEKLPPSLLNSLQKNGISVSSLQKCGISVTNVGSDSKDKPETLNRQASAVPQRNANPAKFSVKENDVKTITVPRVSSVPQVQKDIIKSNSLCQATVKGTKRKIPQVDAGISNKSICIRKPNLLPTNTLLNSNSHSVTKIASVSKTPVNTQNKTFDRTPNISVGSIPSRNQCNVKEITKWSGKSVSPVILPTKVVPPANNPKLAPIILPKENIRSINKMSDVSLKNVPLPSVSQKQQVSSHIINRNAINSYAKPKPHIPIVNSKNIVMNPVTSSSKTPFLNPSLSVTVVKPVKKLDLSTKSSQPIVPSPAIATKTSQSKISDYMTHKNQPLTTSKSIDLTNDREALKNLLTLCKPEDYSDTKNIKIKNSKPSGNKITKGENIKPIGSKNCKVQNIEPIVISIDSENESSPEEENHKSNISSKLSIKLKDVYKTIRHWPKPVVVLERIKTDHIISNACSSKPITKRNNISKSKNKSPVKCKTTKKSKAKKQIKPRTPRKLRKIPGDVTPQCKNNAITLSDVMKYVDDNFYLQPIENSVIPLPNNRITFPKTVNDGVSKSVENSLTLSNNVVNSLNNLTDNNNLELVENSAAQLLNNKINLLETTKDKASVNSIGDSVTLLNSTIPLSDIGNVNNTCLPIKNSLVEISNSEVTLSETLNDLNIKPAVVSSNNKIIVSEAENEDLILKPAESPAALLSNENIAIFEFENEDVTLKRVENSVVKILNNEIALSEAANDVNLKSDEISVTLPNNKINVSEAGNEDISLKPVENPAALLLNNNIAASEFENEDATVKPIENSVVEISNNEITLSEAAQDVNLKPDGISVTSPNNKIIVSKAENKDVTSKSIEGSATLLLSNNIAEFENEDATVKLIENSVVEISNNEITLSEAANDVNLKPDEISMTSPNNKIIVSEAENKDVTPKPVENPTTLLLNSNIAASEFENEDVTVKPIENSVVEISNNEITLSEAAQDVNLKPDGISVTSPNNKIIVSKAENKDVTSKSIESSATLLLSNNIAVSEFENEDATVKLIENSVVEISNNEITLSEAANNVNLKPDEISMTLPNNKIIVSEAENEDVTPKSIENPRTLLLNNNIAASKFENEDITVKPIENSVVEISSNEITSSDVTNDANLKPDGMSVTSLNNKIIVPEAENENVILRPVENPSKLLSNDKIIESENEDDVLKKVENSSTLVSDNEFVLSEIEDAILKPIDNSTTSISNKLTLSEVENEAIDIKTNKNSVTLLNKIITILGSKSEDFNLKPVENFVPLISNNKTTVPEDGVKAIENSVRLISSNPFSEVENKCISLKEVDCTVALSSNNKSIVPESKKDNVSLKPLENALTSPKSKIFIQETAKDEVSLKPVEDPEILIPNNKISLSDVEYENISSKPIENSITQLLNAILSTVSNVDGILKTVENSAEQLSSNSMTLSEVVNSDITVKQVENSLSQLANNGIAVSDSLNNNVNLKPINITKSVLYNMLAKSVHIDDDDFTNNVSTSNKIFHDTTKPDSSEIVKNLLISVISIVETCDEMRSDISVNGNNVSENNEMSSRSCKEFVETKKGIYSDHLLLEGMCEDEETSKDQISSTVNSTNNVQATSLISKNSSSVFSDSAEFCNSANYSATHSTVSICIHEILKKVESVLAVDNTENITEVQCKSPDDTMDTSEITKSPDDAMDTSEITKSPDDDMDTYEITYVLCDKGKSFESPGSLFIDNTTNCSVANGVNNIVLSENKLHAANSGYDTDQNLTVHQVKSSPFKDKKYVDTRDEVSDSDEPNETLNKMNTDQVTSPKLSLKRNRTELTPDKNIDEFGAEKVSKKIKFNDTVSERETIVSIDTTPTVPVDNASIPSTSFASSVSAAELSDEEKQAVFIRDDDEEFQTISNMDSDASLKVQDIFEERKKKFMQLLNFSEPLMSSNESPEQNVSAEEKAVIINRLVNLLNNAERSYIESENFDFLLDISFNRIGRKHRDVLLILLEIKNELKKHKRGKKSFNGSKGDNKLSLTDDSISKDIDSNSSLPSKDKATLGDYDYNFSSSFRECFKPSEKQESHSDESSKTFASNTVNDSGSNLQKDDTSNKKLVSYNSVTNESSSSIIALGWYSEESNTYKSSKQNNRRTSIDDSHCNLQTSTSSSGKEISDCYTNDFSSSAIASAVGLCPVELKTSKIPSFKDPPKEKSSTDIAFDAEKSGVHLSSATLSEYAVLGNSNKTEFIVSSPLTPRCESPSEKFLSKNDISVEKSRSGSSDSLSTDRRNLPENSKEDKNAKNIRKLEKHIEKLHKAIKKCEKEDMSLDDLDDENSAYMRVSRYKKKLHEAHKMLCKLQKIPARTGRIIEKKFHYQGSRYTLINEAIEKHINRKKVHEKTPDYTEILNLIKQVQDKHDLGFNDVEISIEARRIFTDVAEELKIRRMRDDLEIIGYYFPEDADLDKGDPAEKDEHWRRTLEENRKKGDEAINKIIDHYAEKQQQTPAEEMDDEDGEDDAEENDEKDEEEEEKIAYANDDSNDLPRTAPSSPANNDGVPVVDIVDRSDDDIEIIDFSSDKSTDPGEGVTEKKTLPVNKTSVSESIIIEDSESSGDLPSLQELVDKSKIDS